jgi:hypothetical protein
MTKRELIELLKDFSDDTIVLIPGHSDSNDYNSCDSIEYASVRAYKGYSWRGNYTADISCPGVSEHLHPNVINAIVIS